MFDSCPKCGRPLEEGEFLIGDGCAMCASWDDISPKKDDDPLNFD